jgi:hypothetical protein
MSRIALCLTLFLAVVYRAAVCGEAFTKGLDNSPADEPYSPSYIAGGYDAARNFLGGTELMNLAGFQGKLYAGIGYWMDWPAYFPEHPDPPSGAQIVVLDAPNGRWRQEKRFDQRAGGAFAYSRLGTMEVLRFHRFDGEGHAVGLLTELLAVGLDGHRGAVFTQRSPGIWEDTRVPTLTPIRSIAVHYDAREKIEKVYAGSGGLSDRQLDRAIYSGVYDPSAPGRIRWNATPDYDRIADRVMSMAECGGNLFFAAKPSIFRRDDTTKKWQPIYTYPIATSFEQTKYVSGFRGLTCIDDPVAPGKKALLTGFEGVAGDILRIDALTGVAEAELRTRDFLTRQWGAPPVRPDIIAGYNDAPLAISDPETRLFSLLSYSPNPDEVSSAWFMSRTAGSPPRYQLHEVRPLSWPYRRSDNLLWSVRALAISPFVEDRGRVLYLGGYDGHFRPDHNTAWLYRVGIDSALATYKRTAYE